MVFRLSRTEQSLHHRVNEAEAALAPIKSRDTALSTASKLIARQLRATVGASASVGLSDSDLLKAGRDRLTVQDAAARLQHLKKALANAHKSSGGSAAGGGHSHSTSSADAAAVARLIVSFRMFGVDRLACVSFYFVCMCVCVTVSDIALGARASCD